MTDSKNGAEFLCRCKNNSGWITEGEESYPCPTCGRCYKGVYDIRNLTIKAVLIKKK